MIVLGDGRNWLFCLKFRWVFLFISIEPHHLKYNLNGCTDILEFVFISLCNGIDVVSPKVSCAWSLLWHWGGEMWKRWGHTGHQACNSEGINGSPEAELVFQAVIYYTQNLTQQYRFIRKIHLSISFFLKFKSSTQWRVCDAHVSVSDLSDLTLCPPVATFCCDKMSLFLWQFIVNSICMTYFFIYWSDDEWLGWFHIFGWCEWPCCQHGGAGTTLM